jgi:hypothetical protein
MEVPSGFEPLNNGFADRPLGPLGHGTPNGIKIIPEPLHLRWNLALPGPEPLQAVLCDQVIKHARHRHRRFGFAEECDPPEIPGRHGHYLHPSRRRCQYLAVRLQHHRFAITFGNTFVAQQNVHIKRLPSPLGPPLNPQL